jgi:hypothetical protein
MSLETINENAEKLAEQFFIDFVAIQSRKIDGEWETLLNQSKDSYLEFKTKFSIFDRILSILLFVKPSVRDIELKRKNNLLEALIQSAPTVIQFKCSDHIKSETESLLEPAIPIKDVARVKEQEQNLLKQKNCGEMLDLQFAIDLSPPAVGREMYVRYGSASCSYCQRNHTIWPKNLALRFYRPTYINGSIETISNFLEGST